MNKSIRNLANSELFSGNDKYDLLVCAHGYESRSTYISDKYSSYYAKVLCFKLKDPRVKKISMQSTSEAGEVVEYQNFKYVLERIAEEVSQLRSNTDSSISVHIDYSSMPRGWYCRILENMFLVLGDKDVCVFMYTQGTYVGSENMYPSAGVNQISLFAGRPSLRPQNNRSHIIGCGYDFVRTKAILSVLDPSNTIVCFSYPKDKPEIKKKILEDNSDLIHSCSFYFETPLTDFTYIVNKLYEVVQELITEGDVILVPDGPKPMILACSMIPHLFPTIDGVVCLHVSRHDKYFDPIDVISTNEISGFCFNGNSTNASM